MTEYVGTKESATDLATQGDLSGGGATATPSGMVSVFAGSSAPSGWLICDGAEVSRTTYADLFAAIGTTYGAGNGSTTFALPNLKGRMPVGLDSGQTEFDALAETGGAKTVTLATTEIPSHSHGDGSLATDTEADHSHSDGTLATDTEANHSHGTGTLATASNGDHSHGTGTLKMLGSGDHTHTYTLRSANTGSNYVRTGGGTAVASLSTSTATTSSSGNHTHDFTGSLETTGAHTHTVSGSTGDAGSHSHDVTGSTGSAGSHSHDVTGSTGNTGGGNAHNNLQPYVVMNYIIKT